MVPCPSCATSMPEGQRFCGSCGAALASQSQAPTVAISRGPISNTSSPDEGRFPPGAMLTERYRIVGLLGAGGMGEVYRATDLKLSQPVALKFLPQETARNPDLLARFHAEVRIARQVSHPNICRVYDVGEVDGSTFLSMEYIDGEDLRSLLRRIGRLPGDKAVEIARRLCAGLAAAHDKGVLHRDLKPANIMLDGRGQVMITDFGLAGLAGRVDSSEIRHGTPAYMAPEQLAGREVSVRSDLYALGLVLHEMFTGKRAFEDGSQRTTPTNLSSTAKDIDPAVERVILRCLEQDPRNRPPSALAVAAALPGGDPLAEALAAGDTPSPQMVAAAGDTEGMPVFAVNLCSAVILAGLVAALLLGARINLFRKMPFEKPPAALEQTARDLIRGLGYTDAPADRASRFAFDADYRRYLERGSIPVNAQLAKGQPALVHFWYRQSPQDLVSLNLAGQVDPDDPPPVLSGMVRVDLDPLGRLVRFDAVPPQLEDRPDNQARAPDWQGLFTAAGLDMTRFTPAEPQWLPLMSFDTRTAWTGSLSHTPGLPLRVEAASWRGKPVSFQIVGPWSRPDRMQPVPSTTGQRVAAGIGITVLGALLALAVLLAWQNYRAGRGDLRGAGRLAVLAFVCDGLSWLLLADHVPSLAEFALIAQGISSTALTAGLLWILYVALEPYVRRRWPHSLISWSRILAGGLRDPLVGAHVLIGVALGLGYTVLFLARDLTQERYGLLRTGGMTWMRDARHVAGTFLSNLVTPVVIALAIFLFFFLLRVVLRRQWIAGAALVILMAAPSLANAHPVIPLVFAIIQFGAAAWILVRFGVLPMVLGIFVSSVLPAIPLTTDFSSWYAGSTMFGLAVVLALTGYAFHTALAGRPMFTPGLLDAD